MGWRTTERERERAEEIKLFNLVLGERKQGKANELLLSSPSRQIYDHRSESIYSQKELIIDFGVVLSVLVGVCVLIQYGINFTMARCPTAEDRISQHTTWLPFYYSKERDKCNLYRSNGPVGQTEEVA